RTRALERRSSCSTGRWGRWTRRLTLASWARFWSSSGLAGADGAETTQAIASRVTAAADIRHRRRPGAMSPKQQCALGLVQPGDGACDLLRRNDRLRRSLLDAAVGHVQLLQAVGDVAELLRDRQQQLGRQRHLRGRHRRHLGDEGGVDHGLAEHYRKALRWRHKRTSPNGTIFGWRIWVSRGQAEARGPAWDAGGPPGPRSDAGGGTAHFSLRFSGCPDCSRTRRDERVRGSRSSPSSIPAPLIWRA